MARAGLTGIRWWLVGCAALLWASSAPAATFLGLEAGDVIDSVGYTVPSGSGVYTDATNRLDIIGTATSINTTPGSPGGPEALGQISGGVIDVNLELQSESLINFGAFFVYQAVLSGVTGQTDVELFAPTGGPDPEQDGRLLVSGEVQGNLTVQVTFDPTFATIPSFTVNGLFNVTGGDATFQPLFGSLGDLAQLIGTSASTIPQINVLLADGHLFSVTDTNLATCPLFVPCGGTVVNQGGSFNFGASGNVRPQNPAAFVPEPTIVMLLPAPFLALLAVARRRGRS